jgi:hypothetical protein
MVSLEKHLHSPNPASGARKLLIVERKLRRNHGHHHTQIAAIESLLPHHEVMLLAGAGYDGFLPNPFCQIALSAGDTDRALRRLRHGFWPQRIAASLTLARLGRLFPTPRSGYGDDLASACAAFELGPDDSVVVPSATLDDLAAAVDMAYNLRDTPRFILRFIDHHLGERRATLRIQTARSLTKERSSKISLFCETEEMAGSLSEILDHPVEGGFYLPCSLNPDEQQLRPSRKEEAPLRVGVFGMPRPEKGMTRIPRIITATSKATTVTSVEFLVQGQSRDFESGGVFHSIGIPPGVVSVTRLIEALDPQTFKRMFLSADVILLPYDIAVYGLQGSGLVQDAVAAEIPLIHTKGMSMRRLLDHGNAVSATTDAEFAASILQIASGELNLAQGCKLAKEAYRSILRAHPLHQLATCSNPFG